MTFSHLAELLLLELIQTDGRTAIGYDVTLEDAWLEVGEDGEALRVVYRHPTHGGRLGARFVIEQRPEPVSLAREARVAEVLRVQLQEITDALGQPLGRSVDLLVLDEAGVQWWGDGYPDLSRHPDLLRDACIGCGRTPRPAAACPVCGVDARWFAHAQEGGEAGATTDRPTGTGGSPRPGPTEVRPREAR